jgi:hypothetical protein
MARSSGRKITKELQNKTAVLRLEKLVVERGVALGCKKLIYIISSAGKIRYEWTNNSA